MRDNVGCQLLKRNVQIGAMVVENNTGNINNGEQLEKKRANYSESQETDPC